MLFHPELIARTCVLCKQWLYEDEGDQLSGEIARRPQRIGLPMARGRAKTPCGKCPKIPEDVRRQAERDGVRLTSEHAIELSDRNAACLTHWLEARAMKGFREPDRDDPWVRRHARILQAVQDEYDREPYERMTAIVTAVATMRDRRR